MNTHRPRICFVALLSLIGATNVWAGSYSSWGTSPSSPTAGSAFTITIASSGPGTGEYGYFTVYSDGKYLCQTPTNSNGTPIWTCQATIAAAGTYTLTATSSNSVYNAPSPRSLVVSPGPVSGYVLPKFQVVGVYYSPPGNISGSKSQIQYGSSFANGTNVTNSSTWKNTNTVTLTAGVGLFGLIGTASSYAAGWTQSGTSSTSIDLSSTAQLTTSMQGSSTIDGVDHDNDVVWIWLNPVVEVSISNVLVSTTAMGYNSDDPDQMDVIPLTVGELKQLAAGILPSNIPSLVTSAARLDRGWDTGTGALTPADYSKMLQADPFASNAAYNPSGSSRFDATGVTVNYVTASPTGSQICQAYSVQSSTTTTLGQGATDTYTVTVSGSGTVNFLDSLKAQYKVSDMYSYSNTWSQKTNTGSTQTASISSCGPAYKDAYVGPSAFTVWKDNVYGTFALYGPAD